MCPSPLPGRISGALFVEHLSDGKSVFECRQVVFDLFAKSFSIFRISVSPTLLFT